MGFKKISLEKYIALHFKSNPTESKANIKKALTTALNDYQSGVKCSCGNDIWVIGSAFVGNGCFTCITGESYPTDDYEIDSAIVKKENRKGQRHIDDMKPGEIHGFFSDDGFEINTALIQKPGLCLTCIHDNETDDEGLCTLTRFDQRDDQKFICFAYKKIEF